MEFLLVGFIIFFSAFIQGFSGFAFSLVLIPLLGFFFGFHDIVILNVIFSFILNLSVFIKIRQHARLKELSVLIICAMIFTIAGAMFVGGVNEKILKLLLGGLLIVSSLVNFFQIKVSIKNYKKYYPYVGSATGFLNGMSGISGPPLIVFFSNVKMDKLVYKATFNAVFLSLNIVAIVSYTFLNYIDIVILKTSAMYGLFVIVGAYAGLALSHRIEERHFKKIVTVIIFIMGLTMIVGEL